MAIAFELPGSILGGLLIGYLINNCFDTFPWLIAGDDGHRFHRSVREKDEMDKVSVQARE